MGSSAVTQGTAAAAEQTWGWQRSTVLTCSGEGAQDATAAEITVLLTGTTGLASRMMEGNPHPFEQGLS